MEKEKIYRMKSFAKNLNDMTFTDYLFRLMLIARSVFQWENLPNGINEKWIEKFLFNEGSCLFFKDKDKGFMVSKCTHSGKINTYDEPTRLTPYGVNYTGKSLVNGEQCVLIDNNDLRIPTLPTMQLYAYRLAEVQRAIDVNIGAQKTPLIVLCSDRQRLSIKNAVDKVNENELIIYGDKNMDIEGIKALKTDAPIVFPELQIEKHAIWNECMTFLGVNNANMDKRERLVDDEVQANNEQIQISADVMLKSRQEACKRINDMFGLNISVKLREDLKTALEESAGVEDVC